MSPPLPDADRVPPLEPMDGAEAEAAVDAMDVSSDTDVVMGPPTAESTTDAVKRKLSDMRDPFKGEMTYQFTKFSTLREHRHLTEEFELGGCTWKLMLFPNGNRDDKFLALYIAMVGRPDWSPGWERTVHFSLTLVNTDSERSVTKSAQHTFHTRADDWGFASFVELATVRDAAGGFLVDDTLTVDVSVDGSKDYKWLARHYDSFKETGYVGLQNQGATCYMNSLLQTLYHLAAFRKAVYQMPTDPSEKSSLVPLALQRLFYQMQFSRKACSTRELTKSFGWEGYEAFQQHDVQELARVLCDNLEEKMKGTPVDGMIPRLLEGKWQTVTECIDVDYTSKRTQSYYDIQLNVRGAADLYASFDQYVAVEKMHGENQYHTDDFGYQDANRGDRIQSFPPVLFLHLKRFVYDPYRDGPGKINDRFEFYDHIDLNKYLSVDADKSVDQRFRLHSVLVHTGDVAGGHYYAFVKPNDEKGWLKFDDDRVTPASAETAIQDNFGYGTAPADPMGFGGFGGYMAPPPPPPRGVVRHCANAYMLVYVREDMRGDVLEPIVAEDVPRHLRETMEEERREAERRRKEAEEAHLFVKVWIATRKAFDVHPRWTDLVRFPQHNKRAKNEHLVMLRVKREESLLSLRAQVAEQLGVPVAQQQYWTWTQRENKTLRPDAPLCEAQERKPLHLLANDTKLTQSTAHRSEVCLFLRELPAGQSPYDVAGDEILLFFKRYDRGAAELHRVVRYVGEVLVRSSLTVAALFPIARQLAQLSADAPLTLWEEVKPTMIEACAPDATLAACELQNGDILVIEATGETGGEATTEAPTEQHKGLVGKRTVPAYYDYMLNRTQVRFRPLDAPDDDDKEFTLELAKRDTYDDVVAKLAAHLGVADKYHMRLTQYSMWHEGPKAEPISRATNKLTLDKMLLQYHQKSDLLYYEEIDFSILDLETHSLFLVAWHDTTGATDATDAPTTTTTTTTTETVFNVLVRKEGTLPDLIAAIRAKVPAAAAAAPDAPIRVMEMYQHRIYNVLEGREPVHRIESRVRAELVPPEQVKLAKGDRLMRFSHYSYTARHFGEPFFFVVHAGETVACVEARIKAFLGVKEDDERKERKRRAKYLARTKRMKSALQKQQEHAQAQQKKHAAQLSNDSSDDDITLHTGTVGAGVVKAEVKVKEEEEEEGADGDHAMGDAAVKGEGTEGATGEGTQGGEGEVKEEAAEEEEEEELPPTYRIGCVYGRLKLLDPDEELAKHEVRVGEHVVIQHEDRTPQDRGWARFEKPIKIYN